MPLLNDRYAPITFAYGFLEAPIEMVSEALYEWRKTHAPSIQREERTGLLADALLALPPLTLPPRREVLVTTKSKWTAYFDNSALGGDPDPPVGHMALDMNCRAVTFTSVPHTFRVVAGKGHGTHGAVGFALYAGSSPGVVLNCRRAQYVRHDVSGWDFDGVGDPEPFEDVASYRKPRVKDRLTRDMLSTYARSMGILLDDETFFGNRYTLLTTPAPLPPDLPCRTLDEARERLNL